MSLLFYKFKLLTKNKKYIQTEIYKKKSFENQLFHNQNFISNLMVKNGLYVNQIFDKVNNMVSNYIKNSNHILKENFNKIQKNSNNILNFNNQKFDLLINENLILLKNIEDKLKKIKKFEEFFQNGRINNYKNNY